MSYEAILPHPEALTSLHKIGPLLLQVDRERILSGTASFTFFFPIYVGISLPDIGVLPDLARFTSWAIRLFP